MPQIARRCRAALAVAALLLLPACHAATGSGDLVLATWNLEHLAATDGAGCRPRTGADYARLRAAVARLDADVIALQEVENARAAARVFDPAVYDLVFAAQPAGHQDICRDQAGQRRTMQRAGFAIHRARLAALGLRYEQLPPLRSLGETGGRWATHIRLQPVHANGQDGLELLSVHLKSGCAWSRLGNDRQPRTLEAGPCQTLRRQRGILEEWLDERAAAGVPFIVLGDFNRQLDQRNDDFWRAINDASVCDWRPDPDLGRRCRAHSERAAPRAALVLAGAGQPFPFAYNRKFPYAIDHFVLGGGAGAWLIGNSYQALAYAKGPPPSDHHPLRVQLRPVWTGAH